MGVDSVLNEAVTHLQAEARMCSSPNTEQLLGTVSELRSVAVTSTRCIILAFNDQVVARQPDPVLGTWSLYRHSLT
jgi:hypothetical protein